DSSRLCLIAAAQAAASSSSSSSSEGIWNTVCVGERGIEDRRGVSPRPFPFPEAASPPPFVGEADFFFAICLSRAGDFPLVREAAVAVESTASPVGSGEVRLPLREGVQSGCC
ncbi:unnamed protein product, partial [Ectocarpus sp. 8 AP-2014]